jgi:hypothetical protein
MAEQKKAGGGTKKKVAAPQQEFSQLEKRWIELCKAAYRGDLEAVTNLLKLKVLPSCEDPSHVSRHTPLHQAALKGERCRFLPLLLCGGMPAVLLCSPPAAPVSRLHGRHATA